MCPNMGHGLELDSPDLSVVTGVVRGHCQVKLRCGIVRFRGRCQALQKIFVAMVCECERRDDVARKGYCEHDRNSHSVASDQ